MMFFNWLRKCAPIAALVAALTGAPASSSADEFRGIWVDAWGAGFLTASEVTTLVNRCNQYNFNAVVVQMRRRGDAFYFPQAPNGDPRTTVIASNYDALAELITQCHAATPRIEVHCWVTTQLVWSNQNTPPSQAGHVYNLHPEYLMKSSTGATYIGEGYYLDPGHPDSTLWNYYMAKDVVSRYDVDGFHWDYIRYPAQDSGYNDTSVARYNEEFGLTGQPAPSDTQWSNWRRRQVTDFLRWTNSDLLELKPNLVISTAVFASRSDAYTHRFQDWAAWNNEGIIDICMPMNYTSNNSTFNTRVDDAFNNQGVRWVYTGQGAYLNTKENTVTQLLYARNKPLSGTVFYSYRVPNSGTVDQDGTFTYVRDNYQPVYESTPLLPWKATPSKGIIKGTITEQATGAAVYNASVTLESSPSRTQKTEPHGKYAFFEVNPGTYTVSATAAGMGTASGTVSVTAGAVANLNLALPANDTTPPTISNVASSNITDTTARITWDTNEASDSVVEYGTTTAYGSTASDPAMVVGHLIDLSGLSASTIYNYRVKSTDAAGNQAVSANFTFTTLASGTVADIIIDNPAATITGSWTTGTGAVDKYGSDYVFKGQGTGSAYLQYTPNILTAGDYNVYEWHSQGSNRTLGAPHVIAHSGGSTTVNVNQQINGGMWNLLGKFNFGTGTSKHVRITDGFADGGQVVIADAIKFEYASASEPPPSSTAVHVNSITMSWDKKGPNYKAVATVNVVDASGNPVQGATVAGDFSGAISESGSATTDSSGNATIRTSGSTRSGTVQFCVTNITGTDLTYDSTANVETCDSNTI